MVVIAFLVLSASMVISAIVANRTRQQMQRLSDTWNRSLPDLPRFPPPGPPMYLTAADPDHLYEVANRLMDNQH